jgi:ribonuclease P protein component
VKREFRLTRSADIKRVRRDGKSLAHPLFVLFYLPVPEEKTQVAVVATRSVGGAVQRNRAKRRLRAALFPFLPRLKPGYHLLLLARRPLLAAPFDRLQADLEAALSRADLIL